MVDAAYHRRWRRTNRDRVRAAQERYRSSLGPLVYNLVRNHHLSVDDARAAIAAMPEACEICGRALRLYYDHDHSTRAHRGWLCNRCNVALPLIEDPALLEAAITYLTKDTHDHLD